MKKFNGFLAFFLAIVLIAVGAVGGYLGYVESSKLVGDVYSNGEMQVHFLELGNWYTGDCTYIKAGEADILIDAGSRTSSVSTIKAYLDNYVTDGILEYVIVTHAHQDHYAGFATNENTDSIFDLYECEMIIDFALTNQDASKGLYKNYLRERDAEVAAGATHLTARECIEQGKSEYELASGIMMKILDQKFYYEETGDENDYSVCTLFTCGDKNVLLTGDLEKDGEKSLIERNTLPEVELYKAGHHGSKTSSSPEMLQIIKPEVVCVCCCAGSNEYTKTEANKFPTQQFIDNIAPYTDKVYVTTLNTGDDNKSFASMNGNSTVHISKNEVSVVGSANNTKLKDTEWFKSKRTTPAAWQ